MQLFKLKTNIDSFNNFADFATDFNLNDNDLVITNSFLYEPFIKHLNLNCNFVMQEKFGVGEPSDDMMNAILAEVKHLNYNRVIAVGGGTVIDISKIFVIKDIENVTDAFERKIPLIKDKQLVIVPTTCGTGSEVTNISIAEIKTKQTKMGLADDSITADNAVLIPQLLQSLPYKFFAASAIDALIHAMESYLSPKANSFTRIYSREAIEIIIDVFEEIAKKGEEYRKERLEDMLKASCFAGIAFGNAGVGAVHALSYPLGGTYHVPHGEANYQFFTEIFKVYLAKKPDGEIQSLNKIIAEKLNVSILEVYEKLDILLSKILTKIPLQEYGMKEKDIDTFTNAVIETQQRLLANNYVELTKAEIRHIYEWLY